MSKISIYTDRAKKPRDLWKWDNVNVEVMEEIALESESIMA